VLQALHHVARNNRDPKKRTAAIQITKHRELDRNARTVFVPHRSRYEAAIPIGAPTPSIGTGFPIPFAAHPGYHDTERSADCFSWGMAEQAFGGGIPEADQSADIGVDDRIRAIMHQHPAEPPRHQSEITVRRNRHLPAFAIHYRARRRGERAAPVAILFRLVRDFALFSRFGRASINAIMVCHVGTPLLQAPEETARIARLFEWPEQARP
jgi:hypothetical protein